MFPLSYYNQLIELVPKRWKLLKAVKKDLTTEHELEGLIAALNNRSFRFSLFFELPLIFSSRKALVATSNE